MRNSSFDSKHLSQGSDGKYRWTYEMNVITNLTIFLLIWKIFFFIFLGIFGFLLLADIKHTDRLPKDLKFTGLFLLGMTAMVWVGILIYAAMIGGKYCVEFEMDENGVLHRQAAWQVKKLNKAMRFSLRYRTMTKTEMYSDFSRVRKIKAYPKLNVIKVNEAFGHNQIYAHDEDFEFIRDYITAHCGNLKG